MITLDSAVANIVEFYENAPENIKTSGAAWYDNCLDDCTKIANWFNLRPLQVVALVAVSSPLKRWDKNIDLVIEYILNDYTGKKNNDKNVHWPAIVDKMHKIIACENDDMLPGIISSTYKPGGKIIKTLAFFLNISGWDKEYVTIDAHAAGAALGTLTMGYEDRGKAAVKHYSLFVKAYQIAGKMYGLSGRAMQAIVWEYYREVK